MVNLLWIGFLCRFYLSEHGTGCRFPVRHVQSNLVKQVPRPEDIVVGMTMKFRITNCQMSEKKNIKGPFALDGNDVFFLSSCAKSYIGDNATHI